MITLNGSVVLVTGSNGGIGKAFVEEFLRRGASKVYAAARIPLMHDDPRITPILVDVSDIQSIDRAALVATDVSIVVNNAGVLGASPLLSASVNEIELIMAVNFVGPIRIAQAFAPILASNGGGALVNVHSIASWLGGTGGYGASKAALWSATNSLRLELRQQNSLVQGLHFGYTDTKMTVGLDVSKNDPRDIVRQSLNGLEAGTSEVLADARTKLAKSRLAGDPLGLELQAIRLEPNPG